MTRTLLLGAHDQRLGAEHDQLPCRPRKTSFSNDQEMETSIVQACHAPWQPLEPCRRAKSGGGWCHGRHRKWWIDSVKQWTSLSMPDLPMMASHRKDWKKISAESSWQPNRSRDWTDLTTTLVWCFLPWYYTLHILQSYLPPCSLSVLSK